MFIQILQGKCKDSDRASELIERWSRDMAPGAEGWLGGTFGFTDDDMLVGIVRFESREMAERNSNRPEQDSWWREMEQCFDGPVEFHDCDDVTLMLEGGSDDAGFVQVIQGKVDDPERLKAMMTDTDMLHEQRPEIIGATLAIEPDGTFTEAVFFTSEDEARQGEQKPMPEDMQRDWETMMRDVSYLDLHKPWFASKKQ